MKKGYLQPRNTGIIAILLMYFLFGSMAGPTSTFAGKKKNHHSAFEQRKHELRPAFLSLKSLQGGKQGMSGAALDINGDDLKDLVVGAPFAQHGGATGALLVYRSTQKGFSKNPSGILKGDGHFGWSIVSLGDLNDDGREDFAAGAYSGSGKYSSLAGTVTIYYGGVRPRKAAVLEGEHALDKFGYSLTSGDFNSDGNTDLIVGAPFHSPDPALYQSGAVYVYLGPDYSPGDVIKIPATRDNKGIGFSLAAGDINDDGIDDLLIGASGKVIGYCGHVDAFPACPDPDLVFINNNYNDRGFGRTIEIIWDVDEDGYNEIAVGANQATVDGAIDSGKLFILKGGPVFSGTHNCDSDAITLDLLATIEGEPNCGHFASAILPLKKEDGSLTPYLAVSAVHADGDSWPMTGKIFVFNGEDLPGGPSISDAITISGDARDMHLGSFLALIRGGRWIAAGAPTENDNTGTVRLFNLNRLNGSSYQE